MDQHRTGSEMDQHHKGSEVQHFQPGQDIAVSHYPIFALAGEHHQRQPVQLWALHWVVGQGWWLVLRRPAHAGEIQMLGVRTRVVLAQV